MTLHVVPEIRVNAEEIDLAATNWIFLLQGDRNWSSSNKALENSVLVAHSHLQAQRSGRSTGSNTGSTGRSRGSTGSNKGTQAVAEAAQAVAEAGAETAQAVAQAAQTVIEKV